jgi:hypothetical protein
MGGFLTYNEAIAQLDQMRNLYPNLISAKAQIGASIEGRPIYFVKITDNPDLSEGEPQILFTSLHHSQEPASLQQLIMYMWFLLENYGTNDEVTDIVDHIEINFVPIINPDGYVYNEAQNPNGGGTWRKNRRPVDLLFYGVDLNRNYDYAFGYDELGSSSISAHPWYRGDSAFSEPETQAMRDFIEAREFKLAVNWHAYGNYLIYPWNYETLLTADSTLFEQIARFTTLQSHYRYGTCDQTYGYNSNGDADDWAYGNNANKEKILSFTAEIGSATDGFWPAQGDIAELCRQTIDMNLRFTHLASQYAVWNDVGSYYLTELDGTIPFELVCLGLQDSSFFNLSLGGISPWITGTGFIAQSPFMNTLDEFSSDVPYEVVNYTPDGTTLHFRAVVGNAYFSATDTIEKMFCHVDTLFADPCNDFSQWINSGWSVTNETAASAPNCFTDSPGGNYGILQTASLEMANPVDLSDYTSARLQFKAKWMLEIAYDWMEVFASADNGSTWSPLCGRYSSYGSDDEDLGQPVYDGFEPEWLMDEISLDQSYVGGWVKFKFVFNSDQTHNFDGVHLDDIRILACDALASITENAAQNQVRLFPNPAGDFLKISSDRRLGLATVNILDCSGRVVMKNVIWIGMNHPVEVDLSGISNGFYMVNLQAEHTSLQYKLVIQH